MKQATITRIRENEYASVEALNTICGNLIFAGHENKKLLITSCTAGEGKSYMSLQIMLNLAKRGMSVVLVDADLRRSKLNRTYGIELEGNRNGLAARFDYVIVDAPPVGLVVDAAEMARFCDCAIFVVTYNKTRRRDLIEANQQIQRTGCPVIGCIINQVSFETLTAKKYYNKSYYSHYNSGYYTRDGRDHRSGSSTIDVPERSSRR